MSCSVSLFASQLEQIFSVAQLFDVPNSFIGYAQMSDDVCLPDSTVALNQFVKPHVDASHQQKKKLVDH